jgi:hypothetical protein
MRWTLVSACAAAFALCTALPAAAQTADVQALRQEVDALKAQLTQLQQQYEARVAALEARLGAAAPEQQAAQAQPPTAAPTAEVPAGAAGAGGPTGALPVYGNAAAASKVFNPDMAVIGNFRGAAGRNLFAPDPALQMRESEASFQAVVDPYARADFFLSFGEEGVNLEEGFITFPTIPGGLLVKVGKQRAAFGKINTLHSHVVPWADRPLVNVNLLNGEDGLNDAGVSVARLIPNRWMFLEATGQVYRGDSGDLFRSSKRGDLAYVGHLRGYQDITDNTNIDLGVSYARGHNDAGVLNDVDLGRFRTELWGADATVRWRPLQRSIYRSFVGRGEAVWSRRQQFAGTEPAFGYFVSGDYQFARRWVAGARYDDSARATNGALHDRGESVLLTYVPSEFSLVRGQYRRIRYAAAPTANELLFQFQFSIGAHGAHPF